uniref:uncharacterized protein n=1 Tax=Semicossyphus pulcher TaxID=241346 RepID=UPI0037E8C195
MKLKGLIEVSLILVLASTSEVKENWTISVERNITAARGSNVTISCNFTCPPAHCNDNVHVYWKKLKGHLLDAIPNNQNEFIYHDNKTYVLEKYKGKTKLVPDSGNCSLKINNVTENDTDIYVRIISKEKFSFYNYNISIFVNDLDKNKKNSSQSLAFMYPAILAPLAVLLILFIAGIVFVMKHKRKKPVTREESGYYANFSRASSNNAKSEVSCKKIDKLPELNIDDPVYGNVKGPGQMDQSMDQTNNIYANVGYSR